MSPSTSLAFRTRSSAVLLTLSLMAGLAQAGPSRPFKASMDVDHRVGRLTRCPGVDQQPGPGATFTGTGNATHLGTFELHSSHCIAIKRGMPDKPVYISDGKMRLTAANGTVVLADYAGYFIPVSEGVYAFEGTYYFTGGTGRFEDSTGTGALFGTLKGSFDVQMQTLTLSAEGRISY